MDVLSPSERAGAIRSTHNHKGSGCRDCGAIVYDKAAHDRFHAVVEATASSAQRTSAMFGPIG